MYIQIFVNHITCCIIQMQILQPQHGSVSTAILVLTSKAKSPEVWVEQDQELLNPIKRVLEKLKFVKTGHENV